MISVMSFNIRYGGADDGENRWSKRKPLVIDRIRQFDPDLLGLQECVDGEQADYIKTYLPDYAFFARQRGSAERPDAEMAPILYRRASFNLIDSGYFWLSETPDIEGSRSWDSAFARMVMWVRLANRQRPGQTLTFLNTHFDYMPAAVDNGARVLRQQLDVLNPQTPVILTGDFNAEKDSPAYRELLGDDHQGFYDTFRAVHSSENSGDLDEGTFHDFGRRQVRPSIDWLLATSEFETVEAGIDRHHHGDLYPSDHCPIFAVLN